MSHRHGYSTSDMRNNRSTIETRNNRSTALRSRSSWMSSSPTCSSQEDPDIIACIDIGTTYSGYAFGLSKDLREDKNSIFINNEWISGNSKLTTLKVPTTLLLTADKRFHSFGYEAEWKYGQLAADKNHTGWYYFRKFKMTMMQNENPNIGTSIVDDTGKPMRVVAVYSAALKYLTNHLLEALAATMRGVTVQWINENFRIKWVIPHPGNWGDQTKQILRVAAKQIGIPDLCLVTEAEAASYYCQVAPLHRINTRNGEIICLQNTGMKYIVLDLGGGSIDSTLLHLTEDLALKVLSNNSGFLNGGITVDAALVEFLITITHKDVMEKFATTFKIDLSALHKEFEIKKRTFDPRSQEVVVLKLPAILRKIYEVNIKQPLQMKIEQSEYGYLVKLNGDFLQMESDVIKGFYTQSTEQISSSLLKVLYTKESKDSKTIVLVGGFALSPLVQNAVRLKFPDMTILMPTDPDLAVMKGGVLFGHCTSPILYMKARYSYGIGIALPFHRDQHLDEKRFESQGTVLCSDIFQQHLAVGQEVRIGEFSSKATIFINRRDQRYLSIPVFLSTVDTSLYTTETTCHYLGRMKITLVSDRHEKAPITIKMALTYSELIVEVVDEGSGRTIRDIFSDSPAVE